MASERDLQNYLIRLADLYGVYCRKVTAVGHTGFPDIFLARRGRLALVELKSPTGKGRLSKKQEREIERLRNEQVTVYVIDTHNGVEDIIKHLTDP